MLNLLAYFNDIIVGAIVTRIEERFEQNSCYIMTFGVLAAYRRCKIGTMMINELQEMMKNNKNVKVLINTKL